MITEEQEKELKKNQDFQWVAVEGILISTEIVEDRGKVDNNSELGDIDFYSKEEIKEFLDQKLSRNLERSILEMFVKGELES